MLTYVLILYVDRMWININEKLRWIDSLISEINSSYNYTKISTSGQLLIMNSLRSHGAICAGNASL
jgi:hypothetical protein